MGVSPGPSEEADLPPEPVGTARPAWARPSLVALVAAGGALGTLARALLADAVPHRTGDWPWATFAVNVTGAFVLGLLLEVLARQGPDQGRRRLVRLGLGTGFLGGYTTYSTFAVEVVQSAGTAPYVVGPAYAVTSVVLGALAAALGTALARRAPLGAGG